MLEAIESISVHLDRPYYLSGGVVNGTLRVHIRLSATADGEEVKFILKFSAEKKIKVVRYHGGLLEEILHDSVEKLYEDQVVAWVWDPNTNAQLSNYVEIPFEYPLQSGIDASIDVRGIAESKAIAIEYPRKTFFFTAMHRALDRTGASFLIGDPFKISKNSQNSFIPFLDSSNRSLSHFWLFSLLVHFLSFFNILLIFVRDPLLCPTLCSFGDLGRIRCISAGLLIVL